MKIEKSNQFMNQISNYLKLIRIHQPTGVWLLFLPCLFGIFLALKKLPNPDFLEVLKIIGLFLVGSIVMRSAGCVINDLFDKKFDKKVARTKQRPLAAKSISQFEAFAVLAFLLSIGLTILFQFNFQTILSGFAAMLLVIAYPLMKRITYYPQIFLGLTFNFGILMSSLVILGQITNEALILYFAAVIWTVIYDTIYAYQDIEDDLKVGVKSSAIKFQNNPGIILISLSLVMFLTLLFLGWFANFRVPYFIIILLASIFANHKIKNCNFKLDSHCLANFKANIKVGSLILIAIILG